MRLSTFCVMSASLMLVAPAAAAIDTARNGDARLVVVGRGVVKTEPQIASLSFTIRGEGPTSDAAAVELSRKRAAIVVTLSSYLGTESLVNVGSLSILEARDKSCDADNDDNRPRLSSGVCAVRGYVAQAQASIHVTAVANAGTALGLATRMGASDARITGFDLRDPAEARRRAEAAAVADARLRAGAIAAAAGVRLGDLISVEDQAVTSNASTDDIVVTAQRRVESPDVVLPPIVIDLKPEPIETSAAMVVAYSIIR